MRPTIDFAAVQSPIVSIQETRIFSFLPVHKSIVGHHQNMYQTHPNALCSLRCCVSARGFSKKHMDNFTYNFSKFVPTNSRCYCWMNGENVCLIRTGWLSQQSQMLNFRWCRAVSMWWSHWTSMLRWIWSISSVIYMIRDSQKWPRDNDLTDLLWEYRGSRPEKQ